MFPLAASISKAGKSTLIYQGMNKEMGREVDETVIEIMMNEDECDYVE